MVVSAFAVASFTVAAMSGGVTLGTMRSAASGMRGGGRWLLLWVLSGGRFRASCFFI